MAKLDGDQFLGEVHSVFRQAINITAADGDLYSLVSDRLDNAPNTIRIALPGHQDLSGLGIQPGAGVYMHNRALRAADTTVAVTDATIWRPALPHFPVADDRERLKRNLAVLVGIIGAEGQEGGMKGLLTGRVGKDVFARQLAERGTKLLSALNAADFTHAYPAGRSLLGLGGGQTPSGDDFLSSLIAVMHMPLGPFNSVFHDFGRFLAAEAKLLTTKISHAMLMQAAAGRIREKIICLLKEVTQGSQEGTAQAARQVLAIGSMSGTDLAVGIAAGLELGATLRKG